MSLITVFKFLSLYPTLLEQMVSSSVRVEVALQEQMAASGVRVEIAHTTPPFLRVSRFRF